MPEICVYLRMFLKFFGGIEVYASGEQTGGEFFCLLWRREENPPHFSICYE